MDQAEPITEYTIAVDVLGKPEGFKESKDASVRVEVHRLRKRLAEYYEQEGADHAVRIVIPTGQYVPQFVVFEGIASDSAPSIEAPPGDAPPLDLEPIAPPIDEPPVIAEPTVVATAPSPRARRTWLFAGPAVVVIVALALLLVRRDTALDSFWHPVFSSPNPILLCAGNAEGGNHLPPNSIPSSVTLVQFHGLASQMMLVSDAGTLARFAGLLESKGKRFRVASQSETTFADLQNGPAVLIGLANNDWTERLVGKLRFHLEHRYPGKLILRDRENPQRDDWLVDFTVPYLSVTKDYALVIRVVDPKTEQMVVTAAGLSVFGTLAAGEFLTDPQEFRKIEAVAPRGWQNKNFELVLSTDVIRAKSGHPNIVAAQFW